MGNNLGNKETMAKNIQRYMDMHGKTRTELCEALDVPYTTLTDWLNANTYPRIDKIELMANYFEISKADLVEEKPATGEGDELTYSEKEHITKYRECDVDGKRTVDRVLNYEYERTLKAEKLIFDRGHRTDVRVQNNIAAAGYGSYLNDDDSYETISFLTKDVPAGTDYGVRISGDSMEPSIPNGSVVFVRQQPAIEPNDIGIFGLNSEGFCKQLILDEENQKIILKSINPKYEPIEIKPNEMLYTFGKVLGHIKE